MDEDTGSIVFSQHGSRIWPLARATQYSRRTDIMEDVRTQSRRINKAIQWMWQDFKPVPISSFKPAIKAHSKMTYKRSICVITHSAKALTINTKNTRNIVCNHNLKRGLKTEKRNI